MKAKFIPLLFLTIFIQTKSYAQYELVDLMSQINLQANLQAAFNQVKTTYSYISFNGKTLTCNINLVRMNGFTDATAYIQNRDRSKRQNIEADGSMPMILTVIAGSDGWNLEYGDRITVNYNGNSQTTINVGVDDNLSEDGWGRYKSQLIGQSAVAFQSAAAQSYPVNYGSSGAGYSPSSGNRDQITWQIQRTQQLLNDCERRQSEASSSSTQMMYNSQIISLRNKLQELQQQLIQAH